MTNVRIGSANTKKTDSKKPLPFDKEPKKEIQETVNNDVPTTSKEEKAEVIAKPSNTAAVEKPSTAVDKKPEIATAPASTSAADGAAPVSTASAHFDNKTETDGNAKALCTTEAAASIGPMSVSEVASSSVSVIALSGPAAAAKKKGDGSFSLLLIAVVIAAVAYYLLKVLPRQL